ncbi:hypothetical protein KY284_033762 [Solanum tuberosum]|nr:hypothetical protein KY284_033762 [Solanum tuberosum]
MSLCCQFNAFPVLTPFPCPFFLLYTPSFLTGPKSFEDPAEGEDVLVGEFQKLHDDLVAGFRNLEDETR